MPNIYILPTLLDLIGEDLMPLIVDDATAVAVAVETVYVYLTSPLSPISLHTLSPTSFRACTH